MILGKSRLPFAMAGFTLVFGAVTAWSDVGTSANLAPNQSAEEINERGRPVG